MKTIGRFAKEHDITVKTLHHYEKMGLLYPSRIDDSTGYRYYDESASNDLKVILFLKELGFSLSQIREIILVNFNIEKIKDILRYKKLQSKREKDAATTRFHKLSSLLSLLEEKDHLHLDEKELLQMSEKSLFTGKHGRSAFIEESEKMFEQAKLNHSPLCVVQLDLDHFYNINKTYGYDVGDIVIERTQNEMISVLEEHDIPSILERRGGDEFSITIALSALKTSKLVTTLLNRVASIDYSDCAQDLRVRITAGIASITKKIETYPSLVHEATIQLYNAKKNRK